MRHSAAGALVALALTITPSTAHSWVEQMMVISSNGSFTGNPGYARNNTMRTVPGFSDLLMVHILPGQGQPSIEERQAPAASAATPPPSTATAFSDTMSILPTDPMCKKTQQTMTQSNGSPRLQAAPGDNIALRYQENGHVTLPQNQPGKPANRGMVYIYGTTQPKTNENFLDIFKQWTMDGTGGDKRGVLLATQPFDDEQCYQVNSGNISTERQKQYPHTSNQLMGANLWCQNDIALPADAPSGKPYTLYWVWDWPTAPGVDPNLPNGKAEIYTTCMDIDITGTKASRDLEERQAPAASAASGANINIMAVPKYMKELATPNAQATPALSPTASAASSPAATAPAAPTTTAPASPESAAGVVLEASDAQAASEFISYLETAVTAADPSAAKLLASDMATVTVTAPAQTVTVTETPCASSAAMAGQQSIVTISSTISSTMQTVYAASTPVQPAVQAPSQAPAASPSTHAQAPAQAPAQSPAASPSTTAQAAAQAPAHSPAAKSSSEVLPPPVLNLQAPVTSGAPPPTPAAAPAASAASSPASSPASSAAAAGAPPFAASPAASAQIPGSPTAPTTETPPAGVPSAPAAAATPSPPSAAAPAAASPSSSTPAGVFPSGVAVPSGGMQYANSLSFTGTASAVSAAPTGSASPAAAPKGCSVKTACKLKKRSLLLSGHARFH